MRLSHASVVFSIVVTTCLGARASDSPRDTRGGWVMGAVSVGYGAGRYRFAGLSNREPASKFNPETPQRFLSFDAEMQPWLVSLTGALGSRLSRVTALGVGADLDVLAQSNVVLAETQFSSGYLVSGSLMSEIRLQPGGAFVLWQAGLAHAAFTVGRRDDSSFDNIVDAEALNGYVLGLGFGWPLGAVAPFARVRYVELSADHTTYRPLLFNVGVLFQSW